jgi:hypothetical protein
MDYVQSGTHSQNMGETEMNTVVFNTTAINLDQVSKISYIPATGKEKTRVVLTFPSGQEYGIVGKVAESLWDYVKDNSYNLPWRY